MSETTVTLLSALATATAAAIPDSNAGPKHSNGADSENGECKLLGPFSLVIQGSLGALALLSLVWKRYRERPQRPLKIWWFDVSKQVFGSVLVHITNLLMSMLSAGQLSVKLQPPISATVMTKLLRRDGDDGRYQPNPCSFYLLNLAIDTTIGIPILIVLLRILHYGFSYTSFGQPPQSIKSGHYGHPPRASWWLKQSFIYFLGLFGMKICVLIIFAVLPWISRVGDWALRWTEGDPRVQVFFVMLLFPVIMNALQYYIIDGFIKLQEQEHQPVSSDERDNIENVMGNEDLSDVFSTSDCEGPGSDDELGKSTELETEVMGRNSISRKSRPKSNAKRLKEYDPINDGENSPTLVGSTSNSEHDQLLSENTNGRAEAGMGH